MVSLSNTNILNYIEYGHENYIKANGSKTVDYVAFDLAGKGELFDFISNKMYEGFRDRPFYGETDKNGPFSEPMARYYFKQIISGLDYAHKADITHKDLKPESLLLDD